MHLHHTANLVVLPGAMTVFRLALLSAAAMRSVAAAQCQLTLAVTFS